MDRLEGWGAILWRKWEVGHIGSTIIGYRAEDNQKYEIIVPPQLRDLIVEIQNWLSGFYTTVEILQSKVNNIKHFFEIESEG